MKLRKKERTAKVAMNSLLPYFSWLCERKVYKNRAIVASKKRSTDQKHQASKKRMEIEPSINSDDHQAISDISTASVTSATPHRISGVATKRQRSEFVPFIFPNLFQLTLYSVFVSVFGYVNLDIILNFFLDWQAIEYLPSSCTITNACNYFSATCIVLQQTTKQ